MPRAGRPWSRKVHGADRPGHKNVPRACRPRYTGHGHFNLLKPYLGLDLIDPRSSVLSIIPLMCICVYAICILSCSAAYVLLTTLVLADLFGPEKFANSFGLLLLFQGVATIIGPPIVGRFHIILTCYMTIMHKILFSQDSCLMPTTLTMRVSF